MDDEDNVGPLNVRREKIVAPDDIISDYEPGGSTEEDDEVIDLDKSVIIHDVTPESVSDGPDPVTLDELAHDVGGLTNQIELLKHQVEILRQHICLHVCRIQFRDQSWDKCDTEIPCKCSTCQEVKLYNGFTLKQLKAFNSTFGFTC